MKDASFAPAVEAGPEGFSLVRVKVVPGASRSRIAGLLGDRLKVQVAAPPEGGKANEALCVLLGEALGLPRGSVEVIAGHTQPRKTLRVTGLDEAAVLARLERS